MSAEQPPQGQGAPALVAVSVVVPIFDEEPGLSATLEALRTALRASGRTYEIVAVDDGSTDGTAGILAAYADVTVIRHNENRGYGAALKTGIVGARHPLIVVIDADGTYPIAAIPRLLEGCATADMVVGARIGRNVQSAPARSMAKWCFRQFAQWVTGAAIPDLNSGLRAFRRGVAERFMPLFPDGFSFTTTITVASLAEGLDVRFEAVDYLPRIGKSKVRPLRDTARITRQLLFLGMRLAPLRTSAALLLPPLAVGLASSAYHLSLVGGLSVADVVLLAVSTSGMALGAIAEQRVRRRRWSTLSVLASVGR